MSYTVEPFSGKNFSENQVSSSPCAICGKHVENPKHFAIVIDGGSSWGDENSPVDAGHMGTWPVGPDCHRRYKVKG